MMNTVNKVQNSQISSYLAWSDFNLVCRRTLHTGGADTPPEHRHRDFYELVIVARGRGVHRVDDMEREITPGSVFLIEPNQPHAYMKVQELEIFNLLFSRKFIRYFLKDLTELPGFQLIFNLRTHGAGRGAGEGIKIAAAHFPEILRILGEMDELNRLEPPGGRTLLLSDFIRAVLLLSRHSSWCAEAGPADYVSHLSRLLSELERHYAQHWTLRRMAESVHMSQSNFRHEFREMTGTSPIAYLLALRLEKAAVLLHLPGARVSDVALQVGFNDFNYFSRQFKRKYGASPHKLQF